jgi:hypothetical protein
MGTTETDVLLLSTHPDKVDLGGVRQIREIGARSLADETPISLSGREPSKC